MKKNSFSTEEVKSRKKRKGLCRAWRKLHREPLIDQFVTQEVTALAANEHLAHPGFFCLQPGDLSLPKLLKPTLIVTEHMKG